MFFHTTKNRPVKDGSVSLLLARDYTAQRRFCDQISSPGPSIPELQLQFSRPIDEMFFNQKQDGTISRKLQYESPQPAPYIAKTLQYRQEAVHIPRKLEIVSY